VKLELAVLEPKTAPAKEPAVAGKVAEVKKAAPPLQSCRKGGILI
jgi:hypothetical protein